MLDWASAHASPLQAPIAHGRWCCSLFLRLQSTTTIHVPCSMRRATRAGYGAGCLGMQGNCFALSCLSGSNPCKPGFKQCLQVLAVFSAILIIMSDNRLLFTCKIAKSTGFVCMHVTPIFFAFCKIPSFRFNPDVKPNLRLGSLDSG